MDLQDLAHNTRDGLHMASLAGAWTALVEGFGGMRARDGRLAFAPRLPSGIRRLRFRVRYRGRRLVVTANHGEATYQVLEGPPITVRHYEEEVELAGEAVTRPIRTPPNLPRPAQPPGRAPARRGSAHAPGAVR
jgi:alpha,alpha-trehalose phosphorylase